jgi:DNA-binding NtrC family response regulator
MRVYWPVLAEIEAEAPQAPASPRGAGETVLVVDDDAAVRQSAARILSGGGYEVLEAGSAEEALLVCDESTSVDALLTDIVLHDMPGGELAKRLCAEREELTVVYMTGYGDRGKTHFMEGPRVEKPFSGHALLCAVGHALRGEQEGGCA